MVLIAFPWVLGMPKNMGMPLHDILRGTGSVGWGQGPKCYESAGHGGPLPLHKGPDFFLIKSCRWTSRRTSSREAAGKGTESPNSQKQVTSPLLGGGKTQTIVRSQEQATAQLKNTLGLLRALQKWQSTKKSWPVVALRSYCPRFPGEAISWSCSWIKQPRSHFPSLLVYPDRMSFLVM